jgi:hypothetical protein
MVLRSIVILFLLVHAPVVAQWGRCGAEKEEVLQMGRKIEKELPLGSTKVQVAKVLEDMHLQPSQPSVVHGGSRRYRRLRQMGATIETPAHNEPAIYLQFYLDKRGKLVEFAVTNACGPGCYSVRRDRSGVLRDSCD